ncbi:retrovirus-related Pol polyprotein from transposon TNT 1-94 [Cucumis melo var. makuwa]|uniref:Retrovirus-related Pol polyprotein from transposon TNT 1-94 n=1 Tax=Cucumis melo var. makuwa TaxID=1194695 RepID=A0A5A7VLZ8_CUCMM|nr:retrovirus-related Pol polyprotein from transposon TNT 1-94 [Cucumis melo var. makuwa]TYK00939.1 retrovirus-related Pol polyprotein from transposon TNT 1-94 [Cucumis melo var. makuwa]
MVRFPMRVDQVWVHLRMDFNEFGSLFVVLEGTTVLGSAAITLGKVTDLSMLWHKRLAHVSERGLQALSQQGLLGEVKDVELPFCEHCIMGKSTRIKFRKGKYTTKGRKVKYLRTDNGLEFVNNKFNNFCKYEGITRYFTVRYTPQQNCLAERFNRTIMELIRSPTTLSLKNPREVWIGDHVVTEVRIASEVRPLVGLDESSVQSPLVSEIKATQQSESDANSIKVEPFTFEEAIVYDSQKQWKDAMEVELFSLQNNQTWSLVPKPYNQKLIQSQWIYKIKLDTGGNSKPRYKARLVAKGYTQKKRVDFHEIFSPAVRHSSIRLNLSIAVHFDIFIEQMDVSTSFHHGELEEVIYMA